MQDRILDILQTQRELLDEYRESLEEIEDQDARQLGESFINDLRDVIADIEDALELDDFDDDLDEDEDSDDEDEETE